MIYLLKIVVFHSYVPEIAIEIGGYLLHSEVENEP